MSRRKKTWRERLRCWVERVIGLEEVRDLKDRLAVEQRITDDEITQTITRMNVAARQAASGGHQRG